MLSCLGALGTVRGAGTSWVLLVEAVAPGCPPACQVSVCLSAAGTGAARLLPFERTARRGFLWDEASLPLLGEQLESGGDGVWVEQRCGVLFITECV